LSLIFLVICLFFELLFILFGILLFNLLLAVLIVIRAEVVTVA
jgi:hypothetical protein